MPHMSLKPFLELPRTTLIPDCGNVMVQLDKAGVQAPGRISRMLWTLLLDPRLVNVKPNEPDVASLQNRPSSRTPSHFARVGGPQPDLCSLQIFSWVYRSILNSCVQGYNRPRFLGGWWLALQLSWCCSRKNMILTVFGFVLGLCLSQALCCLLF